MHLNCMLSPFLPTVATDVVAQRMFQKGCCLLPRQDAQCELGQKNEVGGMFFLQAVTTGGFLQPRQDAQCELSKKDSVEGTSFSRGAFSSQGRGLNLTLQKIRGKGGELH